MRDFSNLKRIVVKVGSNMLLSEGGIDAKKIDDLTCQIAKAKEMGYQVLLVSSGAIGLGAKETGYRNKVTQIPLRQAFAAIGQPVLMSHYRSSFKKHKLVCAQLLVTRSDFNNRKSYNNLRSSVETLLKMGIVPIFNENDTVSLAEIGTAFGDNDRMGATVASKIDADLLILVTDIAGLYTGNPKTDKDAVLLKDIPHITKEVYSYAKGAGSTFSTGGMKTKIMASEIAANANCGTVIASGYEENVILRILEGEEIGTYIHPERHLSQRERWILNNTHSGSITVDNGAYKALKAHKSLLPTGVIKVEGTFDAGDVVEILRLDGSAFAKAVPYINSTDIALVMGRDSSEIERILGKGYKDCIFRPEDMVFLNFDSEESV